MFALIFLAQATRPDLGPRFTGGGIIIFCLGIGIYKCLQISRRPQTNAKCVMGLTLGLGAWLSSAVGLLVGDVFPEFARAPFLFSMVAICLLIAGVVMAILGLIEYAKQDGKYSQGRAQAISALVLISFTVLLAIGGATSRPRNGAPGMARMSDGQPIVLTEYNCMFTPPGRPWVSFDPSKMNRVAKIGFGKTSPNVFFILIPEKLPSANSSSEALAEVAIMHLNSASQSAKVVHRAAFKTKSLSGVLDGARVQSEVTLGGKELVYVHDCIATNGWAYQLITYGEKGGVFEVVQGATEMRERFRLLDYQARAGSSGGLARQDYISANFYYLFRMKDSPWREWKKHNQAMANFAALHGDEAAVFISTPVQAEEPPELEVMHNIFLKAAGLNAEGAKVLGGGRVTQDGLDGRETLLQVEGPDKSFLYWGRTLRGQGMDYFICTWAEEKDPKAKVLLADALRRVKIFKGPGKLDLTQLTTEERKSQAVVFNAIGLHYFDEHQFEQSLAYFRRAFDLEKKPQEIYFANVLEGLMMTERHQEVIDLTDKYPEALAAKKKLSAHRALALTKIGRTEQALQTYHDAFSSGLRDDRAFRDYVTLLARTSEPDKAIAELESYAKERSSSDLKLLHVSLLRMKGDYDGAISILKSLREKEPFNATANYSFGDTLITANRFSEALQLSKELIEKQKDEVNGYYLKGRSEYGLKWYREAKESFEKALKKAPSDDAVKEFLTASSNMLGEGANSVIKEEIPPVKLPAGLRKVGKESSGSFGREYGGFYLRRASAISYSKGKERLWTDYITARPLNAVGVSAFSTFQISFSPTYEDIFVNRLAVKDAAGGLVSTGNVADYYILDDRRGYASSRKILNIPVAGLQPGYSVELITTRRDVGSQGELPFVGYTFAGNFPSLESVLFIGGDTTGLTFTNTSDIKFQRLPEGLAWSMEEPPVYRWEPFQPTTPDYLPHIWVGDTHAKWSQIVTNYLAQIQDRLLLGQKEKEIAGRISTLKSEQAKVAAVGSYVQTNLTYKAIEFGRRARLPQKGTDIARNKYGDCKDHALLAQQMLTAAGVPSFLALVNTADIVRKDMPSEEQFDHMIVYVPGAGSGRFLDCTLKTADLADPESPGLPGREALVLDAANPRFAQLPGYGEGSSSITLKRKISFDKQNQLKVEEMLTFKGLEAAGMRSLLRYQTMEQRRAYIQEYFSGAVAELSALSVHNLEQLDQPLIVQMHYTLQNRFHDLEREFAGTLPAFFERPYIQAQSLEERVSPFEIQAPLQVLSTVEMVTPPEFRWKRPSVGPDAVNTPYLASDVKLRATEQGFIMESKINLKPGRYSAKEYARFCEAGKQAYALLTSKVVFERMASKQTF